MAEQKADTTELQGFEDTLAGLVQYCDALRTSSAGFAYMLPNDWQGPALSAFISNFSSWETTASALSLQAESLRAQVETAKATYEAASSALDTQWNTTLGEMG
ncbi:hypothetical protein [Humidisolicoccus flavus]|uniref:hypothetical protein n=1 Tax=Humidisolicoccus flavus TaxID=3111414 RepID=UPI00324ED2B1